WWPRYALPRGPRTPLLPSSFAIAAIAIFPPACSIELPGATRRRAPRTLQRSRQPQPRVLPAGMGGEKIAVGDPAVIGRRHARAAPQHVLVHHELAVVLADGARGRLEARVGRVAAAGPLPGGIEHLFDGGRIGGFAFVKPAPGGCHRVLPFGLAG